MGIHWAKPSGSGESDPQREAGTRVMGRES